MTSRRQERVAELLQRELAEMITFELKDPRLGMSNVTRVEMTPDLRVARVYVSTLDDDDPAGKETLAALEHASGYLRRQLGQRVELRFLPELKFVHDPGVAASMRIDALIQQASQPAAGSAAPED
jgi:ribosome-binding factor A